MMEKPNHLPKKLGLLTDICPVCEREYLYSPVHNPGHCGAFDCIYELAMEALEKRDEL